ncbi:MAG: precorrin-6y C5,15-methyltransferase (decarboxylating) subunit CbiE, partial [Bacillota bacterium]|nr:precorrin-6y C5,15-methyltransferase (decarboxylating) subunit CbiE [Bacillota bacterium]
FKGENLVCMQGPFSEEMNKALINQCRARYIVTKDSGEKGGFEEKISAASACNCISIVVGRPRDNDGSDYYQVKSELCRRFVLKPERDIKLIGIGPGKADGLTVEAREAIAKADLAIGASRMIESIGLVHKNVLREYRSEEILDYINQHGEFERVVILLSGDTGFYSGAKKLGVLLEKAGFKTEFIPGISSVNAFMSKIKSSWDDAVIVSNHGMKTSLIPLIRDNYKVVSILGKKDEVASLCRKLCQYDMEDVHVYIGENLSYDDEKVSCGSPRDYLDYENSPLAILCVINESYKSTEINRLACRHDDEFLRDKVPMTKEEVRVISIDRLRLGEDSICYDVGAGTGSVSVEMAIKASKGKVYAIEKKPEAVALIEKNKIMFRVDNIEVVEGFAPEAMEDLPAPTHVFIGGSSGNMDRIVESVLCKNRDARFVINCIAMESVAQA